MSENVFIRISPEARKTLDEILEYYPRSKKQPEVVEIVFEEKLQELKSRDRK